MYIEYKWLILILTFIFSSFAVFIEIVVRLIPHLEKKREKKELVYSSVEKEITKIIEDAENYRASEISNNLKKIKFPPIIKRLGKTIELLDEYNNWRSECNEIILNKLKVDDRIKTKKLRQHFDSLDKKNFDYDIANIASPLIYEGKLNHDSLKEKILNHYGRDLKISIHKGNNVKELTLREIVESNEFFDLAERLKKLENLMSIKTFRKIRNEFINKCEDLVDILGSSFFKHSFSLPF